MSGRKAGEIIGAMFDSLGIHDQEGLMAFFGSWTDLVGVDLSSHSRPIDIRHGSLIVQVDHPGWSQRLNMKQESIVKKIGRLHPDLGIRNIHAYVSDDFSDTEREEREISPTEKSSPRVEPEILPQAAEPLESITDKELRKSLENLAADLTNKKR